MNGILFFRKKQHRARIHVANMADLHETTVKKLEEATELNAPCALYMKLATALGVTVEELVAEYPETMLLPGDHFVRKASSSHPANVLANYRLEHNLNFEQLAKLLGLAARECARVACMPAVAHPEHVATLAALHGLSAKEFQRRYGGGDVACSSGMTA